MKSIKLHEIAKLVEGEIVGDRDVIITGVAGIKEAQKGDITFLANAKYLPFLRETQASAVITSKEVQPQNRPLVRTSDPSRAFTKVISLFMPQSDLSSTPGVHSTAVIDKNVHLGEGVSVGPHVTIEEDASVGDRTVIGAQSFIGHGTVIGKDVLIHPRVTLLHGSEIGDRVILHSGAVIGSDGFGYETINGEHIKIPQIGSVQIEDDVEIGANVCVDRGRFKKTRIQKGTKIDNLVQIAHNVVIGPNCIVVSQSGIAGSTELGKNVVIAAQAGLIGHLTIGDDAIIGAGAGVIKSVPPKTVVLGSPAKPLTEQKRLFALIARLPELFKDISEIKKRLQSGH